MKEIYTNPQMTHKLREFIKKPESGGDYNIVWAGIQPDDRPAKLTVMTIQQVLDWQDGIDHKYMSEAAGAYQIMEDTLRDIPLNVLGLTRESLFSDKNQDLLAIYLMDRRGLSRYLTEEWTTEQFAQSLSREWASLPAISHDAKGRKAKGQSYYAGDGLNKAHVSIEDTLKAVETVKQRYEAPAPVRTGLVDFIGGLLNALGKFFAKRNA